MMVAARSITAAAARRLGSSTQAAVTSKNNTVIASVFVRSIAARHCSSFSANGASIIHPHSASYKKSNKLKTTTVPSSTLKPYFSTSTKLAESESSPSPPPPSSTKTNIIPTKHSRSQTPPIAPHTSLSQLTTHLLSSTPGTLFSYDQSDVTKDYTLEEELQLAIERADVTAQTFEYVLRGHSALLPGSIVDKIPVDKRNDVPEENSAEYESWVEAKEEKEMSAVERVVLMNQLLERMEEEGKVYVELRNRFRSQVATITRRQEEMQGNNEWDKLNSDSSSSSDDSSDSDSDRDDDEKEKDTFGAPPGPTITMYDLVLDALALTSTPTTPSVSKSILLRIMNRHELDGGYGNTNPLTIPTALSYNAVMRACVNIPDFDVSDESSKNLYVRDTALDAAFTAFDAMYQSDVVHRNSATYAYIIGVTGKFIPPSRTRGNIIYALYDKAMQEGVYADKVRQALMEADMGRDGKEFGEWVEKDVVEKGVLEYEHKKRRNCKKRRYMAHDDTY